MQNLNDLFKLPPEYFSGCGENTGTGEFHNRCSSIFQLDKFDQAKKSSGSIRVKVPEARKNTFGSQELSTKTLDSRSLEKLYLAAGVPLNKKTLPADFLKDATFIREEKLGSGFNNEVKKLTFNMNDQENRTFAFKPCKSGFGPSAGTIASGLVSYDINDKGEPLFENDGTPVYLTNTLSKPFGEGCRNIATGILAQMLGCENRVTKTRFFIHGGKLGLLMDLESGQTVNKGTVWRKDISGTKMGQGLLASMSALSPESDTDGKLRNAMCKLLGLQEINFFEEEEGDEWAWRVSANFASSLNMTPKELASNGPVKEQASEAEIIDIISRQADRHSANYVVDLSKSSLKLIDNDLSFGPKSWPDMRDEMMRAEVGCIVPNFPEFISGKMFKALGKLSAQAFEDRLNGLLSGEEIHQTIAAWNEVKEHYEKNPGKVLKPDADWAKLPLAGYLKRDAATIEGKAK